ncbi:MAG: hypothetical protein H6751_00985 [Candidatus Omnitrophica bacterium]|nr:hypothetical protein [Candidatus Omnitrophota bacterium]
MTEEQDQSPSPSAPPTDRMAWMLLVLAGLLLGLLAILFNEFLLGLFLGKDTLSVGVIELVRYSQLWFFIFALLLIIGALAIKGSSRARAFFTGKGRLEAMLAIMAVTLPLLTLELLARPFTPRAEKTWIFMRDDDLGWKLRPNSTDIWGGVRVKINGKGVRGPELDYERSPETYRILYLGDSVTFGFGIEDDLETYPYQVERNLEKTTGLDVETINSGVGGYSPWQEKIFFEKEGIKYQPDLAVIGFYLNDVTEKFKLPQFGGKEGSYQLNRAYASQIDRWLRWSSAWAGIKQLNARMRFGGDIKKSALEIEATNIDKLIREPNDPVIQEAWKITLRNLEKMVESIRSTETDLLLLSLPDKGQIEIPGYGTSPQDILGQFAKDHDIPFLDLLPVMKRATADDPKRLDLCFRDYSHPTALGATVLAPSIAQAIQTHFDLPDKSE